jgi:predicted O-methyltransferase YrrM
MSTKTINITDKLYEYLLSVSLRETEVLKKLRLETAKHPQGRMQISPEQGQFMGLLIKLMGAVKTLEIGVFTGYSSLSVALALPQEGKLIACDASVDFTSIAQRYWKEAGIDHKIELKIAPALETLQAMLESGQAESFDFVFIDADKKNYPNYYELSLQLLRTGGLIAVDNTLWGGEVANENATDSNTKALQAFNTKLSQDTRIDLSLIPIGDGLTLARKV